MWPCWGPEVLVDLEQGTWSMSRLPWWDTCQILLVSFGAKYVWNHSTTLLWQTAQHLSGKRAVTDTHWEALMAQDPAFRPHKDAPQHLFI